MIKQKFPRIAIDVVGANVFSPEEWDDYLKFMNKLPSDQFENAKKITINDMYYVQYEYYEMWYYSKIDSK